MNKALDLLREIRPSIPKEVLELWCKDRDAFLASHPAVEQAGGDERAAFEQWLEQHMSHHFSPELDLAKYEDSGEYRYNPAADYWKAWQARAALAQPSPAQADEKPGDSILCYGCFAKGVGPDHFDEAGKCLAAQAEAERPEVVARVVHSNPVVLGQCGPLNANDELMTVAQHAASVARWAEMFNRVEQQRDAAQARVAELEKLSRAHDPLRIGLSAMLGSFKTATNPEQEGTLRMARQLLDATADARYGDFKNKAIVDRLIAGLRTPVAQAQHSVPGDIMRDAQRYRWLRDQQFYFSFSTENSDAGISSCTAGMSSRFKNLSWVDAAIDSAIAAAPGKEVGHE
ncbi:TPA: hypothetical protein RQ910_004344 [Pseudomonas aeruginosa]|nr:hypothetical protein [Pseudomonas aeruginosa]